MARLKSRSASRKLPANTRLPTLQSAKIEGPAAAVHLVDESQQPCGDLRPPRDLERLGQLREGLLERVRGDLAASPLTIGDCGQRGGRGVAVGKAAVEQLDQRRPDRCAASRPASTRSS